MLCFPHTLSQFFNGSNHIFAVGIIPPVRRRSSIGVIPTTDKRTSSISWPLLSSRTSMNRLSPPLAQALHREGKQADWPQKSDANTVRARDFNRGACDPAADTVRDEQKFGVFR